MILTHIDRARIAALVHRAAAHPLDYRRLDKAAIPGLLAQIRLVIGPMIIIYTHDLLPPDWQPYQHLTATYHGVRPDDALFRQIAAEVGMGDPASWLDDLCKIAEQNAGGRVRHAFKRL